MDNKTNRELVEILKTIDILKDEPPDNIYNLIIESYVRNHLRQSG